MWMGRETQCIVLRLELRLSKRPWPSEFIWVTKYTDWVPVKSGSNINVPQEPTEDHGQRTEPGQTLPRGRRARQHPEREEGDRIHSDGASDGGGQERQHGNLTIFQPSILARVFGMRDSTGDKQVSQ